MQYLKLEKTEVRELRNIVRENLGIYPVIFVVLISVVVVIANFTPLRQYAFQPMYFTFPLISILICVIFTIIFFRGRITYFKDLISNKKKVYGGILAAKQHLSKNGTDKFYFYMDGNKFSVRKEDFEKFKVFDNIQFHLSLHSRHIFKISGENKIDE